MAESPGVTVTTSSNNKTRDSSVSRVSSLESRLSTLNSRLSTLESRVSRVIIINLLLLHIFKKHFNPG
jgi:hypothetical protein